MKIIVDAFGGDNAPQQILLGCAQARESLGIDIVLAGDKARLEACAKELDLTQQLAKMEILPCGQLLTMEDEPTSVIREKSDSSMAVGLRALAQGQGDAFASAGNSGALVVGATTLVKRVRGVSWCPSRLSCRGWTAFSCSSTAAPMWTAARRCCCSSA